MSAINKDTIKAVLSEKEELLLVKYSDNECGFFQRLLARRMISKNPLAAEFVNSLQLLSNEFSVSKNNSSDVNVDLWSRISNRIDQEEKAEFYLGARQEDAVSSKTTHSPSGFFDWSRINIGLSSGVLAAGFALFFIYGTSGNNRPEAGQLTFTLPDSSVPASDNIKNVSANNIYTDPKIDWLRSHAKVRMIRDSKSRNNTTASRKRLPVIWVSRSLPDEIQSPDIDLFDANDEVSGDTPIILKERAPNAVSVINRSSSRQK